ncbi:phage/plasmid primase, P4 family [Chloroflexota bacterium]
MVDYTPLTQAILEVLERRAQELGDPFDTKPIRSKWVTIRCFQPEQHKNNDVHNSAVYHIGKYIFCRVCGFKEGESKLADRLGIQLSKANSKQQDIAATYQYKDENGVLLFEVIRYKPKAFKQRRPDGKGGWIWNLHGVNRVLYRLPELLAAPGDVTVFIPEGEKDVESLRQLGIVATCNSGGAGKFTASLRDPLKNRKVVIVKDKDTPGGRHAEQVAGLLSGYALSVKVMELPGDKVKDAADWVAAGGTREDLERLAEETPEWTTAVSAPGKKFDPTIMTQTIMNGAGFTEIEASEGEGGIQVPGLLEEAVLRLAVVCDGAVSNDSAGFNKMDTRFFRSFVETAQAGRAIAEPFRVKVCRRLEKYLEQLYKLGINLNDVLAQEELRRRVASASGGIDWNGESLVPSLAQAVEAEGYFAQDKGGKLYRYYDGVYKPGGDAYVKAQVKSQLETWGAAGEWSSHLATEVVEYIRVDCPLLWDCPSLDTINVLNGLLKVDSAILEPHDPSWLSPVQLPVAYDPTALCPEWDRFIAQVFPLDCPQIAYQIVAYLMTPDTSFQKAMVLVGDGGNGKSTYLEGVRAFLGRQNTASLSLHKLESDRFAAARLVGKLANICPDLPTQHLADTSVFKALTGGDTISTEHKFKDSFEFSPFARLIFSANALPQSGDSSSGFFDRWVVIPFERRFRGTGLEIPRSQLDAQLASAQDLSGLLNKALTALREIRASHRFANSPTMNAAWTEFRAATDPLSVWLEGTTIEGSGFTVVKTDLLAAYNADAEQRGHPRLTPNAFGRALHQLRPSVGEAQRIIGGRRQWVWIGLGLKTSDKYRDSLDSRDFSPLKSPAQEDLVEGHCGNEEQEREKPVNDVNPVKPASCQDGVSFSEEWEVDL